MKVLYNIIVILGITISFVSCKQDAKKEDIVTKFEKVVQKKEQHKEPVITKKVIQNQKQTIESFLIQLQSAIKSNDVMAIEKSIKFPFEYKSGGESEFHENSVRLIRNPHFRKIIKAKFEKIEENNVYAILYKESQVEDFFIYYYAVKDGDCFKLTNMEMPH